MTSRMHIKMLLLFAVALGAVPASASAARTRAPSAPSSLTATAGVRAVTLRWNAASGSGIAGYRVFRTTSGTWSSTPVAVTNASTLTFSDTGLSAGTTYSYRVTAYNTSNQSSSPSNIASAVPTADPAPAPAPAPPPPSTQSNVSA